MRMQLSDLIMGGIELGLVVLGAAVKAWEPRTSLLLGALVIVTTLIGPASSHGGAETE